MNWNSRIPKLKIPLKISLASLISLLTFVFAVAITHAADAYSITPVYPEQGEYVAIDDFMLVVAVTDTAPDTSHVVDWENGVDVFLDRTQLKAEVLPGLIRWVPEESFASQSKLAGKHRIKIVLKNSKDEKLAEKEWSIVLLGQGKRAPASHAAPARLTHTGRVFAEVRQQSLAGKGKFELYTGGVYRGSYGKLHYGADVLITNLDSAQSQPRNSYTADVGYGKWIDLKVGDTRPQFGRLVLSGQRLRGMQANASVFLKSGKNPFNLDVAIGDVARAVEPYQIASTTGTDSTWFFGTYRRNLFVVRPSFGSGKNFQLGFTFLRGRDDTASITQVTDSVSSGSGGGSMAVSGDTPKDNVVAGSDFIARLFKGKVELFGGCALSFFTKNTLPGPIKLEDIDSSLQSLPVSLESFEDLFIFNASSTPISPYLTGILNSTALECGFRVQTPVHLWRNAFSFKYERLGANYFSMGNPFPGTARKGFEVRDRIATRDNRLFVSAQLSRHSNDLDELEAEGTVTTSFGIQGGLLVAPNLPGLTLGYTRNAASNSDTSLGFDNGVNLINAATTYHYQFRGFAGDAQLFTGWSNVRSVWETADTASNVDTTMQYSAGLVGLNTSTRVPNLPLRLKAGFVTNTGTSRFARTLSGHGGAQYIVFKDRLDVYANLRISQTRLPSSSTKKVQSVAGYGVSYRVGAQHRARWNGYVSGGINEPDILNTLRYEWRF